MQNNVKINFTIISALVFVILSLTNNQKVFCQEYDEVQIFKEMPDSLRKHSTDWMGDYFNSDVRHRIFQEKFTEGGLNSFGVEEYELFEMDPPEPDDVLMPPSYSVEINPKLSCINLMYFSNFYIVSLDFCFFSENKSYSILLFESYGEYYYSDSEYAISKYYFDKKTKTYIEEDMIIPEIHWSDFYPPEQVSKLNMNYLEDIWLQANMSIVYLDNEIVLKVLPNLEVIVFTFLNSMNHNFDGHNAWDDDEMTRDSLGFSNISAPNAMYYSLPNLKLLNSDEFELSYLYNSFCKQYAEDWDIDFAFNDKVKAGESILCNKKNIIDYSDSMMVIIGKTKEKPETKLIYLNNDEKKYFVVCHNFKGNNTESSLRIFECEELTLMKDVTSEVIPTLKNKDFGIDYSENVFEKFPDVFSLKYEADQSSLKISLLVNPPFGNKEAEEIISKMSGESKVLVYSWEELLK